jgi:hypothetical protein
MFMKTTFTGTSRVIDRAWRTYVQRVPWKNAMAHASAQAEFDRSVACLTPRQVAQALEAMWD